MATFIAVVEPDKHYYSKFEIIAANLLSALSFLKVGSFCTASASSSNFTAFLINGNESLILDDLISIPALL
jgi:hypothetical protein